ncbi:TIGR04282 family arsenosugar biosynthesis glycosyltransferase [Zooshikella sp. RANM57]|uniref:TIGR04282 family arsenosugar biosynthesis glycosyltransferase n=1 Tax=Zooshikella sp. RANM57 TaxID=3425863 RepID=UPI003D6EFBD0
MQQLVILFAKPPQAGAVKTRLIPALGEQGALSVHQRLLDRTLAIMQQLPASLNIQLCLAEPIVKPDVMSDYFFGQWPVCLQQGDNLGERLANAFKSNFAWADQIVIIGSDCPVLTADYILQAFTALTKKNDVVIGPAEDGGYVLIGLSRFIQALFLNMPWSTPQLFNETITQLNNQQVSYHLLTELWDVDVPADVKRLDRLRHHG